MYVKLDFDFRGAWNRAKRIFYLIIGIIVELVIVAHFAAWISHYVLFVEKPCDQNETAPMLVYDEPVTSGSFAHIILCLWTILIGLLDTLEYAQITWGYIYREYIREVFTYKIRWNGCCNAFLLYVAALILFAMGFSKITLSFIMEMEEDCWSNIYIVFSAMETFHVFCDIALRMIMLVVMFEIKDVWNCPISQLQQHHKDVEADWNNTAISVNTSAVHIARDTFQSELLNYGTRGKAARYLMHPFKI